MKIVHAYPYFNRLGGIEKYLLDILPGQKDVHEVLLAGGEFDEDVLREYPVAKIPFLRRPRFLSSITFAVGAHGTLRRLKKALGKNVVIHAQGASAFRQDVVTAHSCHKAWFFSSLAEQKPFSWPWLRKIFNPVHYFTIFIETLQYRPGNHRKVIAISEVIKSELIKYYRIDPRRIVVIHSGVDCVRYHPDHRSKFRAVVRAKLGISDSATVLCFVANEFRRKGLANVLIALAVAGDKTLELIVVGRDRSDPFQTMIQSFGITGRVHFTGPTSEVHEYYAASDIFVLPTKYEPFGLVITEAMASGLPVIVSRLAGAAEIMTQNLDGILLEDPEDAAELAAAVVALVDPNRRALMGQKARESALRHQWPEVVREISAVYRAVIDSSGV